MSCEICLGARVIRLTRHRPLSVAEISTSELASELPDFYATFPCPECAGVIAEERVEIGYTQSEIRDEGPELMAAVRQAHATSLGRMAKTKGMMTTREQRRLSGRFELVNVVSRMGFVSPRRVASIEERALEAATKIVTDAVNAGLKEMWTWGSYYDGNHAIRKDVAERLVREGVKKVLDRHRERINEQRSDGDARAEGGAPAASGGARRSAG